MTSGFIPTGINRIQIFTNQGGWIRSFGEEGYWDGQMSYPWGVACAPDGNIFVCDKENHRVQVCGPKIPMKYSKNGQILQPQKDFKCVKETLNVLRSYSKVKELFKKSVS